ncbi:MAG: DUF21 domain-containing protein [Planctomycetaceae bacterium]|nr:DUF21 domain-containing protein [Planctomycetaceae bacterium]
MIPALTMFAGIILFLIGVRLSFFFSGSETGFYRLSPLQLAIRVHQGDRVAQSLQKFVNHPERFVATALVGNNVANYLVTVAIGLVMSVLVTDSSGAAEVISTVVVTPVVFVFGELIPKSLFYLAPLSQLRANARWFSFSYVVSLPLSYPLILLSRFIAKLGNSDRQPLETVLSRTRLVSVLEEGHREGLLTELQSQLADNIIQVARHPVSLSMIPALGVQGAPENASREEILALARRLQNPRILLHLPGQPGQWCRYVRVADLFEKGKSPRSVAVALPQFASDAPKLEVLSELVRQYSNYGVVVEEGRVLGVVSRRTLLAQLQRSGPRTQLPVEPIPPDKVAASIRQARDVVKSTSQDAGQQSKDKS